MSVGRIGTRAVLVAAVCALVLLAGAGSALAETKTFTEPGCSNWEVPAGVSQLGVTAVGGVGQTAQGAEPGAGGNGDELKATVSVAAGQLLDVCVAQGAGKGGEGGGNGGGASGLARSKDFSAPVVVAGGGGGGGQQSSVTTAMGSSTSPGGPGGAAGMSAPGGGEVGGGSPSSSGGPGSGGTGANASTVEIPGIPPGFVFTGAGGGGGGGYVGGGGGKGGGGGAGGTDLCAGAGVTGCATNAGAGTGTGSVTITYTALPTSTDQCKNGGWNNFGGLFNSQGECVSFVASDGRSLAGS